MRDPEKHKSYKMFFVPCLILCSVLLMGCQSVALTSSPSPYSKTSTSSFTSPMEVNNQIVESIVSTPAASKEFLPTQVFDVFTPSPEKNRTITNSTTGTPTISAKSSPTSELPTLIPDSARQLTSMPTGKPWWSKDGLTLYFSTIGPNSKTWKVDLTTNVVQPAPNAQSSYRRAMSLAASLIPTDVSQSNVSVSPSGDRIIFALQIALDEPIEEACDGKACWPIPTNEVWLIDVESRQLTQFKIEGELIAMEVSFSWSNDENRVLIAAPPSWTTGSSTPAVWIADLPSERVYPMSSRDNLIYPLSISPNGDLVLYELERAELYTCDMYLWIVDSQKEKLLPNLPCTAHFWLSDNRTVVFDEQVGHRIVFWAYDVTLFERREIAKSTQLPSTYCSYALAPDETSVAVVPCSVDVSGIWLVEFSLLGNN